MPDLREKYGPDYYKNIGKKGGSAFNPNRGFAGNTELARTAGKLRGLRSKRGYKFIREDATYRYYIRNETGEEVKFRYVQG